MPSCAPPELLKKYQGARISLDQISSVMAAACNVDAEKDFDIFAQYYIMPVIMKRLILSGILIVAFVALLQIGVAWSLDECSLTVVVTGLGSDLGRVDFALVTDEKGLKDDDERPFMGGTSKIANGRSSYTFKNVPYGTYAVKVFHDENESGKLEKGIFGIPKEEYGFSNIPASKKGRPPFSKASFEIREPAKEMRIEVK